MDWTVGNKINNNKVKHIILIDLFETKEILHFFGKDIPYYMKKT
jgi:hypothetical protein